MDIFYKLRPATSVKANEREQTNTPTLCAERFWPEHVHAKAGKETQIDLQGRETGWDVAEKFARQNDLDIQAVFSTSADVVSMQLLVDR